jgi:hypothetical protein
MRDVDLGFVELAQLTRRSFLVNSGFASNGTADRQGSQTQRLLIIIKEDRYERSGTGTSN